MELAELGELELTYTSLELFDFGADGQLYGTMEGRLTGDRVNGKLQLTNLAPRRADNVNLPTLRGMMTTDDGASVWVQLDGIATLRESDSARVFVTTFRFRTGDERYVWLNSVFGVLKAFSTQSASAASLADAPSSVERPCRSARAARLAVLHWVPVPPQTRLPAGVDSRAVVLVEGISDQRALEALAERRGRNLDAEGISVVPIGGAQSIGRFLQQFGPQGLDVRLAGLCDLGEESDFRRGIERAGLGSNLTRADMESLGFYVCVADLEDELIRALGAASVERVVDAQGDLGSFRTLQKQPAWQGRTTEEQLRRFMGSGGSRKIRYARLLIDALDLTTQVPRPLDMVLAHV